MAGEPFQARSSDFSSIADRYDATRGIPERCLAACYARLEEAGSFPRCGPWRDEFRSDGLTRELSPPPGAGSGGLRLPHLIPAFSAPLGRRRSVSAAASGSGRPALILDAGCGTGQISAGLAMGGYDVVGVDISEAMLRIAQSKWPARYFVSDVRKLPLKSEIFDAVVVSKLFQHVGDWQAACCELIRVAKPGAPIVQINERGAFGNAVRRWFSRRADELGFSSRFPGLNPHSRVEITDFMAGQGCGVLAPPMPDLRWETTISYGEALSRIEQRLYAEFWYLPPEVHDRVVADTAAWVDAQPEGRRTIQRLSPYLVTEVFRTPSRN